MLSADQKQLQAWARDMAGRVPAVGMLVMHEAPGFPGAVLYAPSRAASGTAWHGLLIDMRGIITPEQLMMRRALRSRSYRVETATGWVRAARLIVEYLDPTLTDRERRALHAAIPMS